MYAIGDVAHAFGLSVSALRYYDEIGLAPATERRARVRYYDATALRRLAYVHLWLHDGQLGVTRTAEMLDSSTRDRHHMLTELRQQIEIRIEALQAAHAMMTHVAKCQVDDFNDCSVITDYLDSQVDALLHPVPDVHGRASAPNWLPFVDAKPDHPPLV